MANEDYSNLVKEIFSDVQQLNLGSSLPCGILVFDAEDYQILFASKLYTDMLGYASMQDMLECSAGSALNLVVQEERDKLEKRISQQLNTENAEPFYELVRLVEKNGQSRNVRNYRNLITLKNGRRVFVEYIFEIRDNEAQINMDQLTGLLDMTGFFNVASHYLLSHPEGRFSVVYFDVDKFKVFNDKYGFNQGNNSLVMIATTMTEVFPGVPKSRFAADNFVVLAESQHILEKIDSMHRLVKERSGSRPIELKCGIYKITKGSPVLLNEACDNAKLAIEGIKDNYENYFAVYTDKLKTLIELRKYISDNIRTACKNGWIKVYYQPIIRISSKTLAGYEALARWVDPVYGFLAPSDFVSNLEKAHLIHVLDVYMLREICRHAREMLDNGRILSPISLNLSRLDFAYCDIISEIENAIAEYDLPRWFLHIEITESAISNDQETMVSNIVRLHSLGYSVWMDDFGSGYSSLNVLKDYVFDVIKFDMQFLQNFGDASKANRARTILTYAVNMAKGLHIHTLTEGVETLEQLEFLKSIGCEKAQGYFFSKPVPFEEAVKLQAVYPPESEVDAAYYDMMCPLILTNLATLNEKASLGDSKAIAIIENDHDKINYLNYNEEFTRFVRSIGMNGIDDTDRYFSEYNLKLIELGYKCRRSGKEESLDFVLNGYYCNIRVRFVARNANTRACIYYAICMNITNYSQRPVDEKLSRVLSHATTVFDRIDLIDLEKDRINSTYINSFNYEGTISGLHIREAFEVFANQNVHEADKAAFLEFVDLTTLPARLSARNQKFIATVLRFKNKGRQHSWRSCMLMPIDLDSKRQVLFCITASELLGKIADDVNAFESVAYDRDYKKEKQGPDETKLKEELAESIKQSGITTDDLWNAMVDMKSIGLFWKDKDRRFLGANPAFMRYYNFSSLNAILGKNDEDMGWHVAPEVFKSIEESVIADNKQISGHGTCIADGTIHDILAFKGPIIHDGKVAGLIGYFKDITKDTRDLDVVHNKFELDSETGLYNLQGFRSSCVNYVNSYEQNQMDFQIIAVRIANYEKIRDRAAPSLREAFSELKKILGNTSSICRITEDCFVILVQNGSFYGVQIIVNTIKQNSKTTFTSKYESVTPFDVAISRGSYSSLSEEQKTMLLYKPKAVIDELKV